MNTRIIALVALFSIVGASQCMALQTSQSQQGLPPIVSASAVSEPENQDATGNYPPILSAQEASLEHNSSMLTPIQAGPIQKSLPPAPINVLAPAPASPLAAAPLPAKQIRSNQPLSMNERAEDSLMVDQKVAWPNSIDSSAVIGSGVSPASANMPQGSGSSSTIPSSPLSAAPLPPVSSLAPSPQSSFPPIVSGNNYGGPIQPGFEIPTTGQDYFQSPTGPAPVINSPVGGTCSSCSGGGCSSCGPANSGSACAGCNSCGPNGCYDPNIVAARMGCSGSVSCADRYAQLDFLFWQREDDEVGATNVGLLNEYDFEPGWKLTFGRRWNDTAGDEIVYTGGVEWEESRTTTSAAGAINGTFLIGGSFGGFEAGSFFNATSINETKTAVLHSIEYNRVSWGWDVFKTHVGFRYMFFGDDYNLFSQNATSTGTLDLDAQNHIFGPQIGTELFYDVGYRTSWSFNVRGGVNAVVGTLDTQLTNAGTQFIDESDTEFQLGGLIEAGITAHYQLSQNARARIGYSGLWFSDIVTTESNVPTVLTNTSGIISNDDTEILVQSLHLGLEFYR